MGWFGGRWQSIGLRGFRYAWIFILLLLIPLQDARIANPQAEYDHAWQIFLHGDLANSQREAHRGFERYLKIDPQSAARFRLLEAEAMLWRGMYDDALLLLASQPTTFNTPEENARKLVIEGVAFTKLHKFTAAIQRLAAAESLCVGATYPACGGVLRARGILAMENGQLAAARGFFLDSLSFARAHHDRSLETTDLLNLGLVSLQNEHFDEAVDWSMAAYQAGLDLGDENRAQGASGNLGWAYFGLGDKERALALFLDAEERAKRLGNVRAQLNWLANAGYVYQDSGDLTRAGQSYTQALALAKKFKSKEEIVIALQDLAQISVETGKLDEASAYIDQVTPLVRESGNRLDALDVMLAEGKIAAARRQDQHAEEIFRAVEKDPDSQTSMRLGAEHQLARLYESQGNIGAAGRMYRTTLATFESARAQLKNEDSKLPFLSNATRIYDDYIGFLVKQGSIEQALLAADQSRARTLAQGLGQIESRQPVTPVSFSPRSVARKAGATLLFYWLGERQSYLWTITADRVVLFALPARPAITSMVERYRKAQSDPRDAALPNRVDGEAIYQMLVAPASRLILAKAPIMILADGVLSELNFETLLVPGSSSKSVPGPDQAQSSDEHYWIEDATLLSAPSLAMLAAARPVKAQDRSLLLLGNPNSPNPDFPTLPLFGTEMKQVEKHFDAGQHAVFAGQQASPANYLSSKPELYSYIHFVTHATASRTDPLDSAIILSRPPAEGLDSYKLYARDIMQHPIHARLVTISACYGSGTRAYAGEGLVGLSWAFLRAGAHNTIAALWEVSDESTPRLMDNLYQGIDEGLTPAEALRHAKLLMLHSGGRFSNLFYWAPFQIYTRQ